jgi:hypothetical protein
MVGPSLPDGPARPGATQFDPRLGSDEICRWFGLQGLAGLDITAADGPALAAAAALLHYLRELQPAGLPQLARPSVRRATATMAIDEMTRRNLELVEPMRAGDQGTTLLAVVDARGPHGHATGAAVAAGAAALTAPASGPATRGSRARADPRGLDRLRNALTGSATSSAWLAARPPGHRGISRGCGFLRQPDVLNALDEPAGRHDSAELERVVTDFDLWPTSRTARRGGGGSPAGRAR